MSFDAPGATPWLCHDARALIHRHRRAATDVSRRGQSGRRLKFWNTNPIRTSGGIRLSSSSSSRPDHTAEQIVVRRGPIQTADNVHQSRFARTGRPPSAPRIHPHRSAHRSDPARNLLPPSRYDFDRFQEHLHRLMPDGFIHTAMPSIGSSDAARRADTVRKKPTAADTVTAITMACNEKHYLPSREPRNRKSNRCRPEYRSHR